MSSHLISLMCFIMYQLVLLCALWRTVRRKPEGKVKHLLTAAGWASSDGQWRTDGSLTADFNNYKWTLSTMMPPQLWNAPQSVTVSLLMAWSYLVWFANGWKWDRCLQANKRIFVSPCSVVDLRLPKWSVLSGGLNTASFSVFMKCHKVSPMSQAF